MPERVVNFLTGAIPEPIFPIPLETWDQYDMEGYETIVCEVKRIVDHWGDVVRPVNRKIECPTKFYESILGWTGTGIVLPEGLCVEFDIRIEHYLEVILLHIKKNGEEIPIYPGQTVEHEIRKQITE